jgi:hypothetical protein
MTSFSRLRACLATGLVALYTSGIAAAEEKCVTKAGSATGITRGFAEYEALLIIRQVTGNWPIETDRIEAPSYTCKQDGFMWTCRAVAKVCKT